MSISTKVKQSLSQASFIRKMFEEGERLRKIHGPENVYDFSLGNPDLEPPAAFKERLKELALSPIKGMHQYMSNAGYPETRQAICNYLNQKDGLELSINHVLMTVGAGGGLNVAFKALLNPSDEVIVNAPYFVEYGFYVDNHQGKLVVVKSGPDFQPDLNVIEKAINEKTKAILLNSPNNPTGVIYKAEILQELANLIRKKEAEYGTTIYVISDEPYYSLVYDGATVPSVLKIFEHSLLVTSHSKDLALPGERIGYIVVNPKLPEAALVFDALVFANRVLGFVNAPALMQRIITGLQGEAIGTEEYQERRDILYNHLTSIGFEVNKPQGAFYLFPKSPIPDDVAFTQAAIEFNLLLVPGSGFGGPGYFRIAYCVSRETIKNSLPAFTKLAKKFGL
ncbi:MAG TPA: pyridoxal phosphate-dependent aminotransferase [Bacillota bacterium]|nr:pyridoxal phosphate-dependent aminotransferase [Bacillota bacterium]HOL10374.1 pyridoxal phosphate-dependent aminotransferase [Bacillota bacterium]HPO98125.1 pyridoxal phosphate-dependent aminotransferase [Bacillota bacterium]